MNCRIGGLSFDIAASAGWYSAIAGVLAGFALLAILFPLDHEAQATDDEAFGESVVIFTCAFVTLLILGFTYAVLAGHASSGPSSGIAAHEQLLNGAVFGLAVILLLFGLRSVVATYGTNASVFRSANRVMLTTIALLTPLVAISMQFANALDLERYRMLARPGAQDCGAGGLPNGVWINLVITVIALIAVIVLALLRNRLPRSVTAAKNVAIWTLGVAVVVVMWSAIVVPLLPIEFVTGEAFEHIVLAGTSIATVIVATAAWAAR